MCSGQCPKRSLSLTVKLYRCCPDYQTQSPAEVRSSRCPKKSPKMSAKWFRCCPDCWNQGPAGVCSDRFLKSLKNLKKRSRRPDCLNQDLAGGCSGRDQKKSWMLVRLRYPRQNRCFVQTAGFERCPERPGWMPKRTDLRHCSVGEVQQRQEPRIRRNEWNAWLKVNGIEGC